MNGRRHLRVTARSFGIGHLEHHRAPADAEKDAHVEIPLMWRIYLDL